MRHILPSWLFFRTKRTGFSAFDLIRPFLVAGVIRAYDMKTGQKLWRHRLPAGGQSMPMTYRGADGRQYVVLAAGGHGSIGTTPGYPVIA